MDRDSLSADDEERTAHRPLNATNELSFRLFFRRRESRPLQYTHGSRFFCQTRRIVRFSALWQSLCAIHSDLADSDPTPHPPQANLASFFSGNNLASDSTDHDVLARRPG